MRKLSIFFLSVLYFIYLFDLLEKKIEFAIELSDSTRHFFQRHLNYFGLRIQLIDIKSIMSYYFFFQINRLSFCEFFFSIEANRYH